MADIGVDRAFLYTRCFFVRLRRRHSRRNFLALGGRTQCQTVIQPMIRRKDPTSVLGTLSSMCVVVEQPKNQKFTQTPLGGRGQLAFGLGDPASYARTANQSRAHQTSGTSQLE